MTELYPVFFAAIVFVILSGLLILFLKLLNRRWWRNNRLRRASYLLPLSGIISISLWVFGIYSYKKMLMIIGAGWAALTLVVILALLLSLPISGIFNSIYDWIEKRRRGRGTLSDEANEGAEAGIVMPRRRFLKAAAAIAPVVAVSSGISGVAHAFTDVRVYKKTIYFKNLPPALEGLRILHLSDIHIGYYIWLDQIEEVLEKAQIFDPDLLLATGDLCDRLDVYADLLRLFEQFEAPLGAFCSIGNHEHFRGFTLVRRSYESTNVPLLLNNGVTVKHKGQSIYIAGADDPKYLSQRASDFFQRTVDASISSAPSDAFTILLSHRPECLDYASGVGVNLILSGHHHGTQIGLGGRSVFESVMPTKYLWGVYERGETRLYTSAGVGHWFPFRLGCPAEAPVLELRTETNS